ncbi:MAG: TonB-dependent receptor [Erythrobacter sp.]|jgi:iron complex outermembrane receptor protein
MRRNACCKSISGGLTINYLYHGVAAAALLFTFDKAHAQSQAGDADEDGASILVTAQKREQALSEVPLSLDVITGEEFDNITAGGADVVALSGRTSSLYVESSSGRIFPRFYIRGLGNTDFDLNANQPVSIVRDEVVLENPILKGVPLFDIARVEVLRGPQGTLFGRNTPAGVVKFETARPTFEPAGYARLSFGRFDTLDAEGAISGPLSETVAGRFSFLVQRRDDFVGNTFNGGEEGFEEFENFAGRAQFLFQPSEDISVLLNAHGYDLNGGSRVFRANIIEPGTNELVEDFDRFRTAQDARQILQSEQYGASLRVDARLGSGELTSISAYETVSVDARGDVDGGFGASFAPPSGPGTIPFSAESADNITGHGQFTQEIRYAFPVTSALDLTIGGFYFHEDLEIENLSFDTLAGGTVNGLAVQDQTVDAYALFGSAEWSLAERLTLTGGLRLSHEERDFEAERLIGPFGAPPLGPITRKLDDTELTGDVAIRYALNDSASVYARYARGFRAPNAQGRIVFGDAVTVADTETIDSIEAGAKVDLPRGLGFLSGAVFGYRTDNQQLTAVGGAGNFNQLLNADEVEGYGVEIDGRLNIAANFELAFGYSWNKTEINDPGLEVAACAAGCTILDPINPLTGNALIDGNSLPNAPEHIANATARYAIPVPSGEIYLFADWAFRSEIDFFLYESVEFESDAKSETGARIGYVHDGGAWELAAFGRNIFGEVSIEGAIDFNNLSGFVNEPAVWGIEGSIRW